MGRRGRAMSDIVSASKAFMVERCLPLWASRGWDARRGGFVERLDKDGAADLDAPRRVRVQARQIYSFATAELLQWRPGAGRLALEGLEFLLKTARSPDGKPGYVHVITADGAVANPLRDTYDHAFVLLALAAVWRIEKDTQILAEIDAVMAFLDGALASKHGGFAEGVPETLPRRQNPHMHLLEAMLALYEATSNRSFLARADRLHDLFARRFFDPESGTLGEYFTQEWQRMAGPGEVEPGHQAEWVWLLKWYERLSGKPTGEHRAVLLRSALRYSDPATGCLVDEGDVQGNVTKATRRLWPQTECAKAWIAQAESGDPQAVPQAHEALARLKTHYLDRPVPGAWYDQFDRDGRSLVDTVPASTMYHVVCAIAEADRVLGGAALRS